MLWKLGQKLAPRQSYLIIVSLCEAYASWDDLAQNQQNSQKGIHAKKFPDKTYQQNR